MVGGGPGQLFGCRTQRLPGKELHAWEDVLPHLDLPSSERQQLVEALVRLGEQLAGLQDCMREVGVDEDIVDFVSPSIDKQRTQLLALRP